MQLTITQDLPTLENHMQTLLKRLNGDLTPLMRAIGGELESSTRERFETKRDPQGISWEQLKSRTKDAKRNPKELARYRNKVARGQLDAEPPPARGGILSDRGNLRKSITHYATSQSVAVGTPFEYGKYHQEGTRGYVIHPRNKKALAFGGIVRRKVNHPGLPARPFLGLSAEDEQMILRKVQEFIDGVFA